MSFEVGTYNPQNVQDYLQTRDDFLNPAKLAGHLAETCPRDANSFIGREHVIVFAALSGAYKQAATPYNLIIPGLAALDPEDPRIFTRNTVDFPDIPEGVINPTPYHRRAYLTLSIPDKLKHFLEGTSFDPLRPYDHVVRVGDVERLRSVEALSYSTRKKLMVMVNFIFDEVIPNNPDHTGPQ